MKQFAFLYKMVHLVILYKKKQNIQYYKICDVWILIMTPASRLWVWIPLLILSLSIVVARLYNLKGRCPWHDDNDNFLVKKTASQLRATKLIRKGHLVFPLNIPEKNYCQKVWLTFLLKVLPSDSQEFSI